MKKVFRKKIYLILIPVAVAAAVVLVLITSNQTDKVNNPTDSSAQASGSELPEVNENNQKSDVIASPIVDNDSDSDQTRTYQRPFVSPLNHEVYIGNRQSKKIAITLDAGASATQTPKILSILKANNVKCTFFVTGKWAEQNPSLIKQIVAGGHTLGNHTYSHRDLTTLSDSEIIDELSRTENIINSIVPGTKLKPYFRAPYGARNQHVLDVAANAGYQSIYWTVDAWDWKTDASCDLVINRIYENAQNGAVILMHVGDDITPSILDGVLKNLKSKGYIPGTLEDLLA